MKIEEQVLSREQMAHLVELGVDTSDASMMWVWILDKESEGWAIYINNSIMKSIASMSDDGAKRFIPTYTIGDLIGKLPKEINGYRLEIKFDDVFNHISYYISDWELIDYLHEEDMHNATTLDALYKTLCWVAENHKELIK